MCPVLRSDLGCLPHPHTPAISMSRYAVRTVDRTLCGLYARAGASDVADGQGGVGAQRRPVVRRTALELYVQTVDG